MHHCPSGKINNRGVKISLKKYDDVKSMYLCTPSVLSSALERDNLRLLISRFVPSDTNVTNNELTNGECSVQGCQKEKIRYDIKILKPESGSKRVNDKDELSFCSIAHLLEWTRFLKISSWDKKILVHNKSNQGKFPLFYPSLYVMIF